MRKVSGLVALAAMLVAPSVLAWDGSLDLSAQSAYIWRGMALNTEPVFQPSLTLAQGGFSASVWANADLTGDLGHRFELNEVDYWLDYTQELEHFDVSLTLYDYTFPHSASASTQEVWIGATWKTVFSPSLTIVRDINAAKGTYLLLTGTQTLGVLKCPGSDGLGLTVNMGRATRQYVRSYFPGVESDHVDDIGARLEWPYRLRGGTLKLGVQYSSFIGPSLEGSGLEGHKTNYVIGFTFSLPFEL